jgi:HSP20 family protein
LSFEDDFDEIFGDYDFFNGKFMKKIQKDIEEIFKSVKSGKLKGTWETREINEPGVKGYIFRGRFGSDEALEPLEPLKPLKRRPMPEKPFELPNAAFKEVREPLTDVFEEENAIKIYVELPGEEKEDIQLNVNGGNVEVKTKNFYKKIELPNKNIVRETATSEYKNGVLKITILKNVNLRKEDADKQRMV